eukprot:2597392-Rhodomonas_salina.1
MGFTVKVSGLEFRLPVSGLGVQGTGDMQPAVLGIRCSQEVVGESLSGDQPVTSIEPVETRGFKSALQTKSKTTRQLKSKKTTLSHIHVQSASSFVITT